jgi:hypothetical protein
VRSIAIASILLATFVASEGARGEEPAPSKPPPSPPPDLTVKPPPPLDFILLDQKGPARVADSALAADVERRRSYLNIHQATGIATWALMGATVVVGQLNYHDLYGGGGYTQRYQNPHRALAAATTATFAFTGIIALAAPEPYPKKLRLDSATLHKGSMALTTLGIVSQIALGIWAHQSLGNANQPQIARAHQAVGYATFAAMTVGAVTLLF